MTSVLNPIVENGELNDLTSVDDAIMLVLEAFEGERNNAENRKFRYNVSVCTSVEQVQKITYNAYLKRMGMSVI